MRKLYRKVGRRYEPVGVELNEYLPDGVWLIQSEPGIRSQSSLVYRVGDVPRPVDLKTHTALATLNNKLAFYLNRLSQDSDELAEAKKLLGGSLNDPVEIYNISMGDMATLLLRWVALHIEGQKG